jgi:hypothetical protein
VASIGAAGENRVRFATISNEGRHAGRGGVGAVMGSKNSRLSPCAATEMPVCSTPTASMPLEFSAPAELKLAHRQISKYRHRRQFGGFQSSWSITGAQFPAIYVRGFGRSERRDFVGNQFCSPAWLRLLLDSLRTLVQVA